jgi:transposase
MPLMRELRRKGVTLQLVREEYRATHPDGYSRSRFCELYRAWEGRLSPTMRQTHVAVTSRRARALPIT